MTLRSRITGDPPNIEITVDDGGPNTPRTHRADVTLSWDPAAWTLDSYDDPNGLTHVDDVNGIIVWKKIFVTKPPANATKLEVSMTQTDLDADSFVVTTSAECFRDGEGNKDRKKTKKKGKKKVTRKATRKKTTRKKGGSRKVSGRSGKKAGS